MKRYKKIITIILSLLIIFFNVFTVNAISSLDNFKDVDNTHSSAQDISDKAGVTTTKTVPEIIASIIKIVIGLCGVICLFLVIYFGIIMITANGDKEKILKARKNLTPALIGLIILACSYAITDFILNQMTNIAG